MLILNNHCHEHIISFYLMIFGDLSHSFARGITTFPVSLSSVNGYDITMMYARSRAFRCF